MKHLVPYLLFFFLNPLFAQQKSTLTVEKIMRDPKWMGVFPEDISWDAFNGKLYFRWNPDLKAYNPLYSIDVRELAPKELAEDFVQTFATQVQYTDDRKKAVYIRNGDVFLRDVKSQKERQITQTVEKESLPQFTANGKGILFKRGDNIFLRALDDHGEKQLTNFVKGNRRNREEQEHSAQNQWLKEDQLRLFEVLQSRRTQEIVKDSLEKLKKPAELHELAIDEDELLRNVFASPDAQHVAYLKHRTTKDNNNTVVPNYVTVSGYTEDMQTRTKVGDNQGGATAGFVYSVDRDTAMQIVTSQLEGMYDIPSFYEDYPAKKDSLLQLNPEREVNVTGVYWSPKGSHAVVVVVAQDHKDRWITKLSPQTGVLELLDRQHDDAWVAGPGIGGWNGGTVGWVDDELFYFQSEVSGFSHLYTVNMHTKEKKQLTAGNFEVQSVQLSKDKSRFYITANKEHPGVTHFYHLPVRGGDMRQITQMKGGNEVQLSPDEKWLAIRYSNSHTPWELYLQENKAGAEAVQITESRSEAFKSYAWKTPEVINFSNRYGDTIYARLFQPQQPKESRPAVVFVHGAGYLQNVHHWWSSYFREYMFHNLLVDLGYTVLDIDYTASAGYGRNHRTGIYRHMGGKDLTDQEDGVKLLVDKYGVNPSNVGIYGGSYGGFITLMALFNLPDVFAAGAALRSVTDWAHYNHGYTSNILNTPYNDPKAYERSSPINFADGLQGHLLMCHGMVDVNVHFQDIVRLSQRLIELEKENWELAVFPVEDHGFVEASSWTDEYKRILKLFEERLNN
ncbi:prolyl oligopeptidase family serine peptidase [Olivibacter sp. SDN3]|uniref:S9 family peptidase n=1 Tax=Olivibacter sp. SDN3 TaxID=2764720 RepID=UPI0016515E6D|nr:prolyl oligopeptidase family serine peptidase [Olivibacter sp. SDN3]QNL51237.1 prolyl oligopeptidase family serine peptidase [Olivibacter sp. SDN3]